MQDSSKQPSKDERLNDQSAYKARPYVYRFLATLDGPMMNPPDLPENRSTGLQIKLNGGLFYCHPGQMNTSHQFHKLCYHTGQIVQR